MRSMRERSVNSIWNWGSSRRQTAWREQKGVKKAWEIKKKTKETMTKMKGNSLFLG